MLIFLKLAGSLISEWFGKILAFIIAHWRIILPLLIVGYCLHLYFAQVKRADTAEQALATLQRQIKQAQADREKQNIQAEHAFALKMAESETKAKAVMKKYQLDRKRETDNLRSYYEKRIANNRHSWTDRLRNDTTNITTDGLPQTAENTSGFAEALRDCDGTVATIERACQITTNDYNRLRVWADEACKMVGCE